jgi:hemerythrin-like domain-containing protein
MGKNIRGLKATANNLRHGLYSKFFNGMEQAEVAALQHNLLEEIAALRVGAARLFGMSNEVKSVKEIVDLLEAFGDQCDHIATLLRSQKLLDSTTTNLQGTIMEALENVGREWE